MAVLIALVIVTVLAWAILMAQSRSISGTATGMTMEMDAALFLAVWVVMMAAMMFPAAAPMVLMFARVQEGKRQQGRGSVSTWLFVASYLAVWSAIGLVAYVLAIGAESLAGSVAWVGENGPRFGSLLLVAAGSYQLAPLKRACLAQCRSPLSFILTSWRDGPFGALHMGVKHSLYCLGCCWLLFAILFPLGMTNIALLAAVTLLIFVEKSLPHGERSSRLAALLLIGYGITTLVSPGTLPLGH